MTEANVHGELLKRAEQLLEYLKPLGVDEADVVASRGNEFEVKVSCGNVETLTQATSKQLGVRVVVDKKQSFCTSSDFSDGNLKNLAAKAVEMARHLEPDPHHGVAEAEPGRVDLGQAFESFDPAILEIPSAAKIEWAHQMEAAAREVSPKIQKFGDSGISTGDSHSVLVTSSGVVRTASGTGIAAWCNPIAEQEGELQTEFWYDSKTHLEDLDPIASIGKRAGERSLRMLGAKAIPTQSLPIIFEPPMALGFLGGIIGAIDGDLIYKKASFLNERLGTQIASPQITLVDDPFVKRGAASSLFDGEGIPASKKNLIDKGILTTYLYDSYTARKAGKQSTGNGQRGAGSLPHIGTFNVYVEPGEIAEDSLLKECPRALLITRGLGRGVNAVTGEYSRGVNGLLLEHGEVVQAVQEVTIAGDMIEMMNGVDAVGDKVHFRGSSGAPYIRINDIMVSGTS